jgi:hypothetical protein
MGAARWSLIAALLLTVSSSAALAKDNDRDNDKGGPAFCRSGQGHPVYGWDWCRERGWDRVNGRGVLRVDDRDDRWYRDNDDRVYRDRDDRVYRDGRYNQGRNNVAISNGFSDGYEKGLNDGRDNHSFDPTRHKWYKSANRNYDSRYGSKEQYENLYRDGFRRGYDEGYRAGDRHDTRARNRFPF